MLDETITASAYTNRTRDLNERKITAFGRIKYLSDWSRECGLSSSVLRGRIIGMKWDAERALTTARQKQDADWRFEEKKKLFNEKYVRSYKKL